MGIGPTAGTVSPDAGSPRAPDLTGVLGPRIVIAGTHSGAGKTTVATGLMAALRRTGLRVASAKVGPDFIDPGYHALATGRPPRNLDAWICGEDAVSALAARAGAEADILVVEGVMGMFDGAGPGMQASTAAVATTIGAPIVLVVDAAAMSGSVAAMVHGFNTLHAGISVAGVILNRVGSAGHEELLRAALAPLGLPVLGALHRDEALTWRDRHLGLVPVVEDRPSAARAVARLADVVAAGVDLGAVVTLARSAPATAVGLPAPARRVGHATIAIAAGPAFSFTYPDNLERLEQAGAELVPFDPAADPGLPADASGLVVGGGFPEVFAEALGTNRPMLDDVRDRIAAGLVTWAECGGLLWLCRSLDGHPMVGAVPADGTMTDRPTLGYRTATVVANCPLGAAGTTLRGHEYHYSTVGPPGDALDMVGRGGRALAGFSTATMLASYLHLHLGADPAPAERFVRLAASARMTDR